MLRRDLPARHRGLKIRLLLALSLASSTSAGSPLPQPGAAVPIHALGAPCLDPRYPALAGPWVLGCGPDGRVDRALSLTSGQELRLPRSFEAPALAEGLVVGVGEEAAILQLSEAGVTQAEGALVRGQPSAPPVTDGQRIAMCEAEQVSAWPLAERSRRLHPARPMGWSPPALAGELLAWVEDAGPDQADVWVVDTAQARPAPRLLAGGPGAQGHVQGSGRFLAWVEPGALVILDTADGSQRRIAADAGFSAPPSLWQDRICWEERPRGAPGADPAGVDIRCSDGLNAEGPGHQRWPSRFGPWLLYRQGEELWLRTAPAEVADAPG